MKCALSLKNILVEKLPSTACCSNTHFTYLLRCEWSIGFSCCVSWTLYECRFISKCKTVLIPENDENSIHSGLRQHFHLQYWYFQRNERNDDLQAFQYLLPLQSLQISSQFCQLLAKLDDYVNYNLLLRHDTWRWVIVKRSIFVNVRLSTEKKKNWFHNLAWQMLNSSPILLKPRNGYPFKKHSWNLYSDQDNKREERWKRYIVHNGDI